MPRKPRRRRHCRKRETKSSRPCTGGDNSGARRRGRRWRRVWWFPSLECDGACGGSADATPCTACYAAADCVSAGGSSHACGDVRRCDAGCGPFGRCRDAASCACTRGVCCPTVGDDVGGDWACCAGGVGAATHGGSGAAATVRVGSAFVVGVGVLDPGVDDEQCGAGSVSSVGGANRGSGFTDSGAPDGGCCAAVAGRRWCSRRGGHSGPGRPLVRH